MIIKINLAPDVRSDVKPKDLVPIFVSVAVACGLAYYGPAFYAGMKENEAKTITDKTQEKRQQLVNLNLDLNRAKSLEAVVSDLRARQAVIQSLTNGRRQPIAVLERMQDIHLDRMWLASIDYKNNLLSEKGWATDHGVISEYVRRIKITTGKEDESNIDAKTFTPVFQEANKDQKSTEEKKKGNIFPVVFSDVTLKDSVYKDEFESPIQTPIQSFELEFNPNIDTGGMK